MAVDVSLLNANSVNNINTNFERVREALQETLGRDGDSPNNMNADLDMDSNDILNVGTIQANDITIDGTDPTGILERALDAALASELQADRAEAEADRAEQAAEGAGVTDGDKGDVTVSSGGTVWTIDPEVITEPKMADDAVSTRTIVDNAVTLAKIGDDAKDDFRLVDPNGPRTPIGYFATYRVQIVGETSFAMGGFRYRGKYRRGRAPVYSAPPFDTVYAGANRHIIDAGNGTSTTGDLGVETLHSKENWYAVFACANPGDAEAVFKIMPFFRVRDVGVGGANIVRLGPAGENSNGSVASKTYTMPVNGLAGVDCLVIHETLNSRVNGFSGRLTTITENTTSSVSLVDVGTLANGDYLLPAPPGYADYRYIGAFYMDTAELRNIADSGTVVHSRGVNNARNISGVIGASGVDIPCGGYISPLATAVMVQESNALSTTEVGWGYSTWGMDDSHDSINTGWYKPTSASASWQGNAGMLPFSFSQWVNLRAAGTLNTANNTRQMRMYGWIEP